MAEPTSTPKDVLSLAKDAEAQIVDLRFCDLPGLILHFSVKDPVTGEMYSRDPRGIARKAEQHLVQTGIAQISYWGPECEFYIFDSIRFDQNQHEGYYHIGAVEGAWNTGAEEGGHNL